MIIHYYAILCRLPAPARARYLAAHGRPDRSRRPTAAASRRAPGRRLALLERVRARDGLRGVQALLRHGRPALRLLAEGPPGHAAEPGEGAGPLHRADSLQDPCGGEVDPR